MLRMTVATSRLRWLGSAAALVTALALAVGLPGQKAPTHRTDKTLRVLFVGHDPAAPKIASYDADNPRTQALHRERTAAWESLLRYHFANVKVVHGDDYAVAMSDDVDVTIFDTQPKAITEAVRGKDPVTGKNTYKAATYLPESFDRPALMISQVSSRIGEPLGSKLDWL